jgi:hypothetical protein
MDAAPFAVALCMVALAVSGCSSTGGPSTASGSGATSTSLGKALAGLQVPVLKVGDWWNYTATGIGALSYVVSGESGGDYVMDTDNGDLAFFNALFDVSTLGAIRKSDLAGSQNDGKDRVEFFRWPMTDGKNWTTKWDNLPLAIKARQVGPERFQMTATRSNGTTYATYTYDNRTRWFTGITFHDEKGDPGFELKLQASGTAFPGTLKRWNIKGTLSGHNSGPVVGANSDFTVPDGSTDVQVSYTTVCGAGAFTIAVGPLGQGAQGTGYTNQGPCDGPHTATVPATPGMWGIAYNCAAQACDQSYQVYVRQLVTFGVGKAPA